jgi:hypothetical protein
MSTVLPKVGGGIFSDIVTWVRRLLKSPSEQAISTTTIGDYVNRFWCYDVPERIQLFEMKRQYTFETIPNIFEYQAPFTPSSAWNFPPNPNPPPFIQDPAPTQSQTVMPLYHMFRPPIYCDGVQMGWYQSNDQFYRVFPELVQNQIPLLGTGVATTYTLNTGRSPILRAYIDDLGHLQPYVFITALQRNGDQQYIVDSGYKDVNGLGILIQTDSTFQNIIGDPLDGTPPISGGNGLVNYLTGQMSFTFESDVPFGNKIEVQTSPYSAGFPRICLFYNNTFKLYPVPARAYKIQVDAYITPAVFFNSQASIPFAYMSEYIARGAARKILSDTGDYEQTQFYEPLFKEQEALVLRRTSRQNAVMRTPTIFSGVTSNNPYQYTQY